jgi:hypothetical protein
MASTPTYADEKGGVQEIERIDTSGSNQAYIDCFTPEEQKRIIRKVDLRLIPTLGFMYCVSLMDRTNLGGSRDGCRLEAHWRTIQLDRALVLYHLRRTPTSGNCCSPKAWSASLLTGYRCALGCCYDWLRFCQGVAYSATSPPLAGCVRGWILPR